MRALAITFAMSALAACSENLTPSPTGAPAPPIACVPDLDGVLAAAEVPVVLDTPVAYTVSVDVPVDVAGQGSGGAERWDWSAERQGDTVDDVSAAPLAAQWYASMFPGGQFVSAIGGRGAGVDGVYAHDDTGVYLLGIASHAFDPPAQRTLLRYAQPVAVLRTPLTLGAHWTELGVITGGTLDGLPYNGTDTYEIGADAAGELHLPYVRFTGALRVRTLVTIAPATGGVTTTRRQVSFWFECFGEVGRALSRANEPAADFTTADEVRRFAL